MEYNKVEVVAVCKIVLYLTILKDVFYNIYVKRCTLYFGVIYFSWLY